ncbi:hypothetical protein [Tardiphaga sp. 839_C3_N1_4]|uniref:hypothetical protein n=1 Tax=Tardiphaga sp. 839_C3_N1_4 TaxID=3240761 RepID=UPI003F23104C
MRQHSKEAWDIASQYSHVLASETRDLAAQIDDLITKLRAERDAAVLAERDRCKKSVRNTICNMSWPPDDGDQLIDDLQTGIALFATEGNGK